MATRACSIGQRGAKWLVVEIEQEELIDIDDKVKFPRGIVVYAGDRQGATSKLIALGADPTVVPGAVVVVGDRGTATATVGPHGTATAGESGTAIAGYRGTATAGQYGTATAGYRGTATVGPHGTATVGPHGTAIAGYRGTATAGQDGIIQVKWWGGDRCRIQVGYIGEQGLQPNVKYRLDDTQTFVAAR